MSNRPRAGRRADTEAAHSGDTDGRTVGSSPATGATFDSDETEGRKLYHDQADALARSQIEMSKRKVRHKM